MKTLRALIPLLLFISLLPHTVFGDEKPVAYVIELHGEIDRSLMVYLSRGVEKAIDNDSSVIIFDIDTFGGRVDSALQITSLIGGAGNIPTVAFVTTGQERTGVSWSAGALIAFSCDRIYMAPGTSIGAAAPVYQTPEGGMEMAPEKVVSATRTQMAALAEKNGYPKGIALAMVDKDVELVEAIQGDRVFAVTGEEFEIMLRDAGKKEERLEKGRTISPAGKLLTLTAGEMERYGVSSGTVSGLSDIYSDMGLDNPDVVLVEQTVPDRVVAVLTSAGLTSLLVIAGVLALFMELTSPGFGVPGTASIICFAVVFISNFMLGTVGSLELLLFLLGVVLLVIELFIIPGFGVTGISGILLIVVSLVLSRQAFILPEVDWQWDIFRDNLLIVLASLTASFILLFVMARFLPRVSLFRRGMVLTATQRKEEGFTVQSRNEQELLLGKKGIALTVLRPVGKAEIDDRIVVVETEGDFIPAGTPVEVVEINSNRIVVKGC